MRRKLLSVVLCVCMMMTMVPFAFAEENPSSGGSGSASGASSEGITTEDALKTAITNATAENKTVTLDGDITLTSQLTINKSITLNGNGYTIKANKDTTWSPDNSTKHLVSIEGTSDVTFENVILDCNNKAYNVQAYKSSNVTFKDVTITNSTAAALAVNASSMTVKSNLTMSGNAYNYVNVCWGKNISNVTSCDFTVADGTNLKGVIFVYADKDDVLQAGENGSTKFKITLPSEWINSPTTDQPILYYREVAQIGNTNYPSLAAAITATSDSNTVTLLKDTVESVTVPGGKTITLNLNGNKITAPTSDIYNAISNKGTLTITDSKKTGEIVSGLNNGIGIFANSNTTIEYAKITGREGAIGGYKNTVGAILTINDGIFNGIDNAVVIFNGTNREGSANTITINGGTFNGTIQTNGYVACGIYAPWKDNITVKGGIFNITGGAGIVARAGNVTVTGGEFNTTGNTTGKVGDSRVVVPCSALVFDSGAKYPALTDSSKLTINGGKFKSDVNNIAVVIPDTGDTNTRVEVTKGYFTSDPTTYCTENLTGVASDLSGYAYMVGNATTNNDKASTDSTTVKANVATNIPQGKEELVNNVAGQMTDGAAVDGKNLEAIVKSEADNNNITKEGAVNNTSVTNYNSTVSDADKLTADNVAIVYQSYIDVTVSDVEKTEDTYSQLTVDLTPMYRVVATKQDNVTSDTPLVTEGTSQNAVVIQEGKQLNNVPVKNYEVKLALPNGFAIANQKLSIKHTKSNGSVEYYTGTVSTEGENASAKTYVTFTTNGFSPFTIYAASANVASIGDGENEQVFTSFQAAVDAVENNGTIKALQNITSTVSGNKTFIVDANSNTVNLTAASGYNLTKDGDKYTVSRQHSSSSGSTSTTYDVKVNAATNGAVAADKKTASKGTTVTVTATPSTGYVVDSVKVVDKDGKDVAVTVKDGKYVFTMPGSAVTVTATFKAETPAPSGLPFTDVKSGDWFYDAVKYAYEQGLMTGTSATTFAPNGTMNRAMIVTVLYRLEKSPAVTAAAKFTDVPAGQWYSDAVAWAAANNIVNGYDETTFGPMNAVTREQMAAILYRYEQYKGMDTVTLEENLNRFPDKDKISAYAVPALQWAVGQKVINGNADGTLNPTGTATRAQVAQIFMNLLNK